MASYLLTEPALADLDDILTYLSERSPKGRDRIFADLLAAFELLAEFPLIGVPRPTATDSATRFWFRVRPYVIAYRPEPRVRVLRIVHASRDLARLFDA